MLEKKEIEEKIKSLLINSNIAYYDITNINYKPHPYCITDKHIVGCTYLTDDSIKQLEKEGKASCGMYVNAEGKYINGYRNGYIKCNIPYTQHTSDKVLMLQLIANISKEEASNTCKLLINTLKDNAIDGIVFVENDKNFKII